MVDTTKDGITVRGKETSVGISDHAVETVTTFLEHETDKVFAFYADHPVDAILGMLFILLIFYWSLKSWLQSFTLKADYERARAINVKPVLRSTNQIDQPRNVDRIAQQRNKGQGKS